MFHISVKNLKIVPIAYTLICSMGLLPKGWEPTFLIGALVLSEELSTKVGFAFSNNGLQPRDLRFGMKKKIYGLFDKVA